MMKKKELLSIFTGSYKVDRKLFLKIEKKFPGITIKDYLIKISKSC